jgi:hypothetical protein
VFVSWLGATVDLSERAVMETCEFLASAPACGSELVLSYVTSPSALAAQAAALGEPWRTFFDSAKFCRDLLRLGFLDIEDFEAEEANERYFKDRTDGLAVVGSDGLMSAYVADRPVAVTVH